MPAFASMTPASLHSLDDLAEAGLIPQISPELQRVAAQFAIAITPAMAELIKAPDDPIAAQFVPSVDELAFAANERVDPIGDAAHSPVEGIVHRYRDRVLLKALHLCPVYCRFCFRREQVGDAGHILSPEKLDRALTYIRDHDEIWEVILSGGDPLLLSDRRLGDILSRLNAIPHVKVIRLHSRVPVVDPPRVTPELVSVLKGRAPVYILLHANHPRELTSAARAACALLVDAGIPMLSQSVLLRGVNDSAAVLEELMRCFVECRIKPHYLHHLDLARGIGHFRVPLAEGQELMRRLRGDVSGLCQPVYILDIPGGYGKVPVGPIYLETTDGGHQIMDNHGSTHRYDE